MDTSIITIEESIKRKFKVLPYSLILLSKYEMEHVLEKKLVPPPFSIVLGEEDFPPGVSYDSRQYLTFG